jgi:hypothetical protein
VSLHDDAELLGALDPAQRSAATRQKLPRRKLGRGAVALLILLRIYVAVALPIVGYAFVHALMTQH